MIISKKIAQKDQILTQEEVIETLIKDISGRFTREKVLVLIPDHTRSLPLPFLFRALVEILQDVKQLDFMVALGTHPPLIEESLNKLVGITTEERTAKFKHIGLLNHSWKDPDSLISIGSLESDEIKAIAGLYWHPSLPEHVNIRINTVALDYDQIIILGPTFPHEVAGFSGGAKYLFPGISGEEMINATHWLGALSGVVNTIGFKNTPVRTMINAAARKLTTPVTLVALTVVGEELAGLFIGDLEDAWNASVDASTGRHIHWCEKPYHQVLSCAPSMYDELWTAAKAMYKLEPVVETGGEVIIYAPHLDTVSRTHEKYIYKIGYHILPFYLNDWKNYRHIPLGVLAHSTHLRGSGVMENNIENPNVRVTLASKIPPEDCAHLNLGYIDPIKIDVNDWVDKEDQGILYVSRAGETLYRLKSKT